MQTVQGFLTILTIGVVGGVIYTLATHPDAVDRFFTGVDRLYKTAGGLTLGQVV